MGRINKQTEATHCEKESGRNSVLIVDPPGIERSEVNRFAELCRNLACEAISYWFSQSFVLDFQVNSMLSLTFPVISGYAPKSECQGTLTYK